MRRLRSEPFTVVFRLLVVTEVVADEFEHTDAVDVDCRRLCPGAFAGGLLMDPSRL